MTRKDINVATYTEFLAEMNLIIHAPLLFISVTMITQINDRFVAIVYYR